MQLNQNHGNIKTLWCMKYPFFFLAWVTSFIRLFSGLHQERKMQWTFLQLYYDKQGKLMFRELNNDQAF